MMRSKLRWVIVLATLLVAACDRPPKKAEHPPDELWVAVLDDPVFYQPSAGDVEASGFEYDLLLAFAESRGKRLHVVTSPSPAASLDMLAKGEVDFVAAAPVHPNPDVAFSETLRETRPLVAQHADSVPVEDVESLADRTIELIPGTLPEPALARMAEELRITIAHPPAANGIELLARVAERRADLAATDSAHFDVAANFYPDLMVAQQLPGKLAYAWAFRAADTELREGANAFVLEQRKAGNLARVHDRYFGHIKRISPIGAIQFIEDMRRVLPRYRRLFEQAEASTGIDWRLLAALAYQESKWDPLATSYTGVRGMMMLTEDTADRLGVGNRLDAAESVRAGAKYLADLIDRLPEDAEEPDRTWLALAAYNLGMGHLNGARHFAVSMKRDPNSWYDMKKVLPLMSRPEYYERLKSGRARGGEAVVLVENVRTYYDILVRFDSPKRTPLRDGLARR